jgi:hypothetical protein
LVWKDRLAAIGVFLMVFLSTLFLVLPFVFIHEIRLALRTGWSESHSQASPSRSKGEWPALADEGIEGRFVVLHESAYDALDGSSTGTRVPLRWELGKAPWPCRDFGMIPSAASICSLRGVKSKSRAIISTGTSSAIRESFSLYRHISPPAGRPKRQRSGQGCPCLRTNFDLDQNGTTIPSEHASQRFSVGSHSLRPH